MNILVYGAKGWIGNQFIEILENKHLNYIIGNARVDNEEAILKEISLFEPTHIISFIGRTHGKINDKTYTTIDYLEQEGKLFENVRDNLYSPLLLAEICTEKNIHYTYLGTGCIFAYDKEHCFEEEKNGFAENDLPNFYGSSYSIVKGFTDRLMHRYNNSILNLRIRMPITGEPNNRNFITKIINYNQICSISNSMTVLPELLEYVVDMLKNKTVGTLNLTNPGLISHNEILEMYKEIVDPAFKWQNFSQKDQRRIIDSERSNNFLDTNKLEKLYPQVNNIKTAVKKCLIEYRKVLDSQKNLLITGGCGFIGSNFINFYFNNNSFTNIVNLDAMYYCAKEDNVLANIRNDKKYVFIKGNLNDNTLLTSILKNYNITHIIHFAAQSHVQNSFEDSIKFTNDNIVGTHNLLECCRKYNKIQKFIHVSTDEVYGESMNKVDEKHKTEHSILCPTNPYAATKAGAELIAQSYNHSYKMPIIITRGNNVYGPNQYPEKLIPLFIKQLKENKKVTIQGNGSSVRAFLHAYDTAKAFQIILEKGEIGEIYNIGCDENMEYSVLEIAKILIKLIKNTDKYEDWIEYIEDRPYNDMRYYISNQKVKDLGWNIQINLMSGLTDLILENKKISLMDICLNDEKMKDINIFGDWIQNLKKLSSSFVNADPFDHIIIPNFLDHNYAQLLLDNFPENIEDEYWHKYNNPIEYKYALDKMEYIPTTLKEFFFKLSSKDSIEKMKILTKISNLEYDPYLHGAGLHIHPTNGLLHMHLDYEKHPFTIKERRLNVILYLNKDWDPEWKGDTELWDKEMQKCIVKSTVIFNTALIFKTNDISWHGLPEVIKCPEGIFRKTVAFYYISDLQSDSMENKIGNDGSGYRTKATFTKRPEDAYNPLIEKLYGIRPHRLITPADLI